MTAEIQVQENDTILITNSGKCYSWNNNTVNEGLQHKFGESDGILVDSQRILTRINQHQKYDQVSQIEARGDQYFAISKGQLFQLEKKLLIHTKVDLVSVGNSFCQFISSLQLYSFGENDRGQLGLGDLKPRDKPCKVNLAIIHQVSCGFSHVIARSFNKVYVWGDNMANQLGIKGKYIAIPQLREFFNITPISIAAGRTTSFMITDNHKIFVTGRLSDTKYPEFTQFPDKYAFLQSNMFPLRIQTTWSRTMSIVSCNFAFNQPTMLNNNLRSKIINSVVENWKYGLNPPLSDAQEKYFRQQKRDYKHEPDKVAVTEEHKQIKTRIVNLMSIPQSKWTHADHLFMRNTKI